MTFVDAMILGAIVLSIAVAAAQGFFYEAFSLAGVIIGYIAAAWEYARVAVWYAPFVKSEWIADVAGFLSIFLAVVVLAGVAAKLARWGVREAGLRWFDRLLGGVFGLLRGVLLITVVLVAVAAWTPNASWLAGSQLAPYLLVVGRTAVWAAPSQMRMQFRESIKQLHNLSAPQGAPIGGK